MEPQSGMEWFEEHADANVVKAMAHPIRLSILVEAARRPVSAKEMADSIEEPLPKVSYHVRVLADAGLLQPVRRTRRRGAIETHYRAVATLEISPESWHRMPTEVKTALSEAALLGLAQDVSTAVRHGAHEQPDYLFARSAFRADAAGRRRVDQLVRAFYSDLAELELELDKTPPEDPDDVLEVSVALASWRGRSFGPLSGGMSIASEDIA